MQTAEESKRSLKDLIEARPFYPFGAFNLPNSQVFFVSETGLSFASVNLKPVQPGHILAIPVRHVKRVRDLTHEELADLWSVAKRASVMLEKKFNNPAFSFVIQDGPEAGQTVPHVHIHVIPRRLGDFARNDDIYHKMEEHLYDKPKTVTEQQALVHVDSERQARTAETMAAEASEFRTLMEQLAQKDV